MLTEQDLKIIAESPDLQAVIKALQEADKALYRELPGWTRWDAIQSIDLRPKSAE